MFDGNSQTNPPNPISSAIKLALVCLIFILGILACSQDHSQKNKQNIQSLQQVILWVEEATDNTNAVFVVSEIESHRIGFATSLDLALQKLQTMTNTSSEFKGSMCLIHVNGANLQDGCQFIEEARFQIIEMKLNGSQLFDLLAKKKSEEASRVLAKSHAALAQVRHTLMDATDFYVNDMQQNIADKSRGLQIQVLSIIAILIMMSVFSFRLMLKSRRQTQELLEKEKSSREYTKKLELIGREVRRLRDLGSAVNAAAGVLIFNQNHRTESVNERFCKLRGIKNEDVKNQTLAEIFGLPDDEILESIIEVIGTNEIWRGELNGRKADGSGLWMYVLFYPELDELEDFEGSIALVLDITESKKTQMTLDRTRHLTALGEIAGGVAHEINNPLSVINGRATVLLKKAMMQSFDPATFQTGLEQIQRTVKRIAKIVESMRRLSRSDAGASEQRPEKIDFILRETLEFIEEKLKKCSVTLTINDVYLVSEASVMLHGFGLSQILINLISNAADAIDENAYAERWIRIELSRSLQNMLRIKVIDPGQGISKDIVDKIMDPFFTTKPPAKGTGLGLSLSLRIAEEHGGKIFYDPDANSTTFVLELPELIAIPFSKTEVA